MLQNLRQDFEFILSGSATSCLDEEDVKIFEYTERF